MGQIRVTRKMLENYRNAKREIKILEEELEEMRRGDAGLGSSTVFDYRTGFPRAQSVVGFDWGLYGERRSELERKKAQVEAVEKWIRSIEDGQTRCVFRMRYIDGMKWERIAEKTGYRGNADYPRLMLRDKYLKKMGMK